MAGCAYRYEGKQKTISLGTYPLLSLAQARIKLSEVKSALLAVDNPMQKREQAREARKASEKMKARNRGSDYVFHAEHRLDRPISDSTILMLFYRIAYKGKMTGHGWRTIGSTWANENGYSSDAIERQLAHFPEDRIRAVNNHADYLSERRKMLQDWADWLASID